MNLVRSLVVFSVLLLLSATVLADWPHMRGPATDGRIAAPGTFEADDIGLALAWRIPLGSAYSGIAVANGRAVTMFGDEASDWVVALDARTGKEIWRHRLGELTRAHDGSDAGPLGSH